MTKRSLILLGAALLLALPASAANIFVNNVDAPGVGFNDATPVAPVGGNPGTTLGQQRLIIFQLATSLWGSVLDSNVDIIVQSTFQPLGCSPNAGTLGAAGPLQVFAFGAAPPGAIPATWYHVALANSLAGFDLAPGPPDPGLFAPPFADDMVAFFNGAIGVDPNCLTGLDWYYGVDNNAPSGTIDLLNVVMHEFAHGLGFSEFVDEGTGQLFFGLPDGYSRNMLDTNLGLTWDQMTDAQRLASQVSDGALVWAGAAVTAVAPQVLGPRPTVEVLNPGSIAGGYGAQAASFGGALNTTGGTSGQVVEADDGVGVGTDGCEPLINNVNGKIALIDRGSCAFSTKVLNAQVAGAKGVIVVNNVPVGLPSMGGSNAAVTIPSVGVTQADGNTIRAELASKPVVKLLLDPNFLAGANDAGQVRLYAPNPVAPGSSKSHWDVTATPNLLMEPFNTSDLKAGSDLDLTPFLFLDIGWNLLP